MWEDLGDQTNGEMRLRYYCGGFSPQLKRMRWGEGVNGQMLLCPWGGAGGPSPWSSICAARVGFFVWDYLALGREPAAAADERAPKWLLPGVLVGAP